MIVDGSYRMLFNHTLFCPKSRSLWANGHSSKILNASLSTCVKNGLQPHYSKSYYEIFASSNVCSTFATNLVHSTSTATRLKAANATATSYAQTTSMYLYIVDMCSIRIAMSFATMSVEMSCICCFVISTSRSCYTFAKQMLQHR